MGLYLSKVTEMLWTINDSGINSYIDEMSNRQYHGEEEEGDLDITDWEEFKESQYIGLLYLSGADCTPTFLPNKDLKFRYSLTFSDFQDILKMMISMARESGCTIRDGEGNVI